MQLRLNRCAGIRRITKHLLICIHRLRWYQFQTRNTVMHRSNGGDIVTDKLGRIIRQGVIFVTKVRNVVFRFPASIGIFLRKNMRIRRKRGGNLAALDLFILRFCITLFRHFDDSPIDDQAAVDGEALPVKFFAEAVKQLSFECKIFKLFGKEPDRFRIGKHGGKNKQFVLTVDFFLAVSLSEGNVNKLYEFCKN